MKPLTSYTSRTDVNVEQLPSPIPSVALGQNALVTDPTFNTRIVRATDASLNPNHPGFAYFAGLGGSADVNSWNQASTKFCFEDQGGRRYVMAFDPKTMKVSPLFPKTSPQGTFCVGAGAVEFAHQGDLLYHFNGAKLEYFDFSKSTTVAPDPVVICDFTKAIPGFAPTWQSPGGVSRNGKVFAAAFSTSGGQGTGSTILVYTAGRGFTHFDTMTGAVSSSWGMNGTIKSADRSKIHNVKLSANGEWLIIAVAGATPGTVVGKHFWRIGTLNYTVVDGDTAGHFTRGYAHYINNGGTPFGNYQSREFLAPAKPKALITQFPATRLEAIFDQHPSWNNVDPTDSLPFFASTTTPKIVFPGPWYNEIIGVQNGKVIRFCHTYNTGVSQYFSGANAIGCVSQDGRWFVFCSDWMETLGPGSLGPRIDVFVAELK